MTINCGLHSRSMNQMTGFRTPANPPHLTLALNGAPSIPCHATVLSAFLFFTFSVAYIQPTRRAS
ncbi:hypothetical protein SISSUDRAFT_1048251 [Sistotremastrum suecicum HHB10207 ss-3]|uniref:Uncharacterized protein n=1 Tax=Sistotremastrum suecicum HHB10207 ss-3 TaxID=1314776 RepID=A0A166CM29_9AGAM|nr:hypothetical protein SISSUDRAFT_1048251 [Sistotremastrum suecicum HHB10207 ss-3]